MKYRRIQMSAWGLEQIKVNKNNRLYRFFDFAAQADHKVEFKKIDPKVNYLDLAKELKKTCGICK